MEIPQPDKRKIRANMFLLTSVTCGIHTGSAKVDTQVFNTGSLKFTLSDTWRQLFEVEPQDDEILGF